MTTYRYQLRPGALICCKCSSRRNIVECFRIVLGILIYIVPQYRSILYQNTVVLGILFYIAQLLCTKKVCSSSKVCSSYSNALVLRFAIR